jgi:hypothetical protein
MSKHLAGCAKEHLEQPTGAEQGGARPTEVFQLVVEGHYNPQYWLQLAAPATANLGDVDGFLREIWLECCGHLSAFEIAGRRYTDAPDLDGWGDAGEVDLSGKLGQVLRPGLKFTYEYDFGSTTKLKLRVAAVHQWVVNDKHHIQLLARNEPPRIPCGNCGQPAAVIDTEAAYDPSGWLCADCAAAGEIDRDMCLPVVNSPRTGVCGYTGT